MTDSASTSLATEFPLMTLTDQVFSRHGQALRNQKDHLHAFLIANNFVEKRCFVKEIADTGKRRYFVVELDKFWSFYSKIEEPRYFHEMIQENYACRLYFDLEYPKSENQEVNEDRLLDSFIDLVNELVAMEFSIQITKKSWLLLDSSREEKFSVHAIVHFPNQMLFPSNSAMKRFIKVVETKMQEKNVGIIKKYLKKPVKVDGRMVLKDDLVETFVYDPVVYDKNRQLRLFLSAKFGKCDIFKYRIGCTFYDQIPDDKTIFYDSLVVPRDHLKCPKLDISEEPQVQLKMSNRPPKKSANR